MSHILNSKSKFLDPNQFPIIKLVKSPLMHLSLLVLLQSIKASFDGTGEHFSFKVNSQQVLAHHEFLIAQIVLPAFDAESKGRMSLLLVLQDLKVKGAEQNGELLLVRVGLCQDGEAYLLIELVIEAFPHTETSLNV